MLKARLETGTVKAFANSACLSRCSGGLRPLVVLCVEPAGVSGRCTGESVPVTREPGSAPPRHAPKSPPTRRVPPFSSFHSYL